MELLTSSGLLPGLVPIVAPEAPEAPVAGLAGPLVGRGGGGGGIGQAPLLRPPHHLGLVEDGQLAGGQGQGSLLAVQVDAVILP